MDLRKLKAFVAVAEEQSFTRAAERLHLSQPPLTRQIQSLEDELGVSLFNRSPRGVELTLAGEALLNDARHIQVLVEQATEHTRLAGSGKIGRLEVGVFGTAQMSVLPELFSRFTQRHPGVKLVLHPGQTPAQEQAVRQGRVKLVFERQRPVGPDMAIETVCNEALVLGMRHDHSLARLEVVDVALLRGVPLIVPSVAQILLRDFTMELCRAYGFEPTIGQTAHDMMTGAVLASCGMGCVFLPESMQVLRMPHLVYRPIRSKIPASIDLICFYRRDDPSPLLQALLDVVREHALDHTTAPRVST